MNLHDSRGGQGLTTDQVKSLYASFEYTDWHTLIVAGQMSNADSVQILGKGNKIKGIMKLLLAISEAAFHGEFVGREHVVDSCFIPGTIVNLLAIPNPEGMLYLHRLFYIKMRDLNFNLPFFLNCSEETYQYSTDDCI